MNAAKLKKAAELFENTQGNWQTILSKVKALNTLNKKVADYLDPSMQAYCQVANFTTNKLIIAVANSSIATQLRYQAGYLLERFSRDRTLRHIQHIEIKIQAVAPSFLEAHSPTRTMPTLSPATAELIKKAAEELTDPQLQEIMQRIASRQHE